jgi:hypothetical protein
VNESESSSPCLQLNVGSLPPVVRARPASLFSLASDRGLLPCPDNADPWLASESLAQVTCLSPVALVPPRWGAALCLGDCLDVEFPGPGYLFLALSLLGMASGEILTGCSPRRVPSRTSSALLVLLLVVGLLEVETRAPPSSLTTPAPSCSSSESPFSAPTPDASLGPTIDD